MFFFRRATVLKPECRTPSIYHFRGFGVVIDLRTYNVCQRRVYFLFWTVGLCFFYDICSCSYLFDAVDRAVSPQPQIDECYFTHVNGGVCVLPHQPLMPPLREPIDEEHETDEVRALLERLRERSDCCCIHWFVGCDQFALRA